MIELHKIVNGVKIPLNEEEIAEYKLNEELHLLQKEEEMKTVYIRQRQDEYPSIEDQLDLMYHGGLEGWRAKIKEIKDKYPKPEA